MDAYVTHLGENLRTLRTARRLSQQRAAALAGIPRATWATLESGSANPTLAVLVRVAGGLQVRIEELLAPPRPSGRLYRAEDLPLRRRGGASLRDLLPEKLPCVELGRIELPAGASLVGVPHTPGTREYLTCEVGSLILATSGEQFRLRPRDVVVFQGDQRHSYRNPGRVAAVGYSVVLLATPFA
ncbi:MAG: helix-turn-helix domain-containing protein [Candidatus Binatia bacterium]